MMIKALLFDFDGTILDTETPEMIAWNEVFAEYDLRLDRAVWTKIVGATEEAFDLASHLETQLGFPIDQEALRWRTRDRRLELIYKEEPLPGAGDLIREAAASRLKLAIVSTSPRVWVEDHLGRLGLRAYFSTLICAEDVERRKPDPEPYLRALKALGVRPGEAIVLEDSVFGVQSAKAAGIYTIAIPNQMTALFDLSSADRQLNTLENCSLTSLIGEIQRAAD